MGQLLSYVEDGSWNGPVLRRTGKSLSVSIRSVGKIKGRRVKHDVELPINFFFWNDEVLCRVLQELEPEIDWSKFIYFPMHDFSSVEIINPSNDKLVAQITIRRGNPSGEKKQDEIHPATNIVSLAYFRKERENGEA